MSKKLQWRGLLVLVTIVIAFVYLLPSINDNLPSWWSRIFPKEKIKLGLDLKGGMHLVLEVQTDKALENHLERMVDDIKYSLREEKIRYKGLRRSGRDRIEVILIRDEDKKAVEEMIERHFSTLTAESGFSREDRLKLELVLSDKAQKDTRRMSVDQAVETITTG